MKAYELNRTHEGMRAMVAWRRVGTFLDLATRQIITKAKYDKVRTGVLRFTAGDMIHLETDDGGRFALTMSEIVELIDEEVVHNPVD